MVKERKYLKAIYNWHEDERPRKRLLKFGADKIFDTEFLAILLRVGLIGIAKIAQIKTEVAKYSAALVLIHNHPSGEPQPIQDDIEITNHTISACKIVGIEVLDHIIIGDNNYFIFSLKV